jgi:hypothetical protein
MMRPGFVLVILAACGPKRANTSDASLADTNLRDDAMGAHDATVAHDAPHDAHHDAKMIDAFPSVLDVHIRCRNDCVLVAQPPSISVMAGTGFEVNWINTGDTVCDVTKVDPFNQVPIVIGLEPGTSYHDTVHTWCGTLFTGTFDFRINICTLPSYIPVNCGA